MLCTRCRCTACRAANKKRNGETQAHAIEAVMVVVVAVDPAAASHCLGEDARRVVTELVDVVACSACCWCRCSCGCCCRVPEREKKRASERLRAAVLHDCVLEKIRVRGSAWRGCYSPRPRSRSRACSAPIRTDVSCCCGVPLSPWTHPRDNLRRNVGLT